MKNDFILFLKLRDDNVKHISLLINDKTSKLILLSILTMESLPEIEAEQNRAKKDVQDKLDCSSTKIMLFLLSVK
jgi:hypothetical protein